MVKVSHYKKLTKTELTGEYSKFLTIIFIIEYVMIAASKHSSTKHNKSCAGAVKKCIVLVNCWNTILIETTKLSCVTDANCPNEYHTVLMLKTQGMHQDKF